MELQRPIKALLLDMDGVIYRGDKALPGAVELFPALHDAAVDFALVTNNSRLTAEAYSEKLEAMDIHVGPEKVFTSAQATAAYLRQQSPNGGKVFVIGAPGLVKVILDNPGFSIDADDPDFVIVGLDYDLTYARLRTAALGINKGARFVATNPDASIPVDNGEIWPGAGSIIAALQTAVGKGPEAILGKPSPFMLNKATEMLKVPPAQTLVVGDRADTDILAGKRAGLPTALVLTGVTKPEEVANLPEEMRPDFVFNNLAELLAFVLEKK